MTPKEQFYALLKGECRDRVPVMAYHFLLPRGEIERKLREAGCGLLVGIPIYDVVFPSQIILEERHAWEHGEKITVRTYITPLGSLQEVVTTGPYGNEWRRKYFIEKSEDYDVMMYLLEKAIFQEKVEEFVRLSEELGEDGVAVPMLPFFERSPFQKILIDLAGPERTLLDLYDRPRSVEDLMTCLLHRLEDAMGIYRDLPERQIFWWVDNVTADFTTPQIFRTFCLPVYEKFLGSLRRENVFCMVHLDGKLRALKELIQEAPVDVVESFTLPEQGGDLELEEAQKVWENKVIAANVPANLSYRSEEEIMAFLEDLLERRCMRGKFALEISEDIPREHLSKIARALCTILEREGF